MFLICPPLQAHLIDEIAQASSEYFELFFSEGMAGRFHKLGRDGHTRFDGKTLIIKMHQELVMNAFQLVNAKTGMKPENS